MTYHSSLKDGILTTFSSKVRKSIITQLKNDKDELEEDIKSPVSSVALGVNTFGFFYDKPNQLPQFLNNLNIKWDPKNIEFQALTYIPDRPGFPPHLDVLIDLPNAIIGIINKRYEPFRGKPKGEFSKVYWKLPWGNKMKGYCDVRDMLHNNKLTFEHFDAYQIIKCALGMRSVINDGKIKNASRISDAKDKKAFLIYLYAEPEICTKDNKPINNIKNKHSVHRDDIKNFATRVMFDEVEFIPLSYQNLLSSWYHTQSSCCPWIWFRNKKIKRHVKKIEEVFNPYYSL